VSFIAIYPQPCGFCGISMLDTECRYFEDVPMHMECADAAWAGQVPAGVKVGEVCPTCFQAKAANGKCGCET
jgi:hypothetical protein